MYNINDVITKIQISCDKETAGNKKEWNSDNPLFGHCKVASLVLQDYFGGELVLCKVGKYNHCYNVINGKKIDVTEDQFGEGYISIDDRIVIREEILSSTGCDGYELLKSRVEKLIIE